MKRLSFVFLLFLAFINAAPASKVNEKQLSDEARSKAKKIIVYDYYDAEYYNGKYVKTNKIDRLSLMAASGDTEYYDEYNNLLMSVSNNQIMDIYGYHDARRHKPSFHYQPYVGTDDYIYDSNGRLLRITRDKDVIRELLYDKNGKVVERREKGGNLIIKVSDYADNGDIIWSRIMKTNGSGASKGYRVTDSKGNVLREVYTEGGYNYDITIKRRTDGSASSITTETTSLSGGKMIQIEKYNANGDVIESSIGKNITTRSYEYNPQGDWIKCTDVNKDDFGKVRVYIATREITYK